MLASLSPFLLLLVWLFSMLERGESPDMLLRCMAIFYRAWPSRDMAKGTSIPTMIREESFLATTSLCTCSRGRSTNRQIAVLRQKFAHVLNEFVLLCGGERSNFGSNIGFCIMGRGTRTRSDKNEGGLTGKPFIRTMFRYERKPVRTDIPREKPQCIGRIARAFCVRSR